jgi:phosphopantothenate synthetase
VEQQKRVRSLAELYGDRSEVNAFYREAEQAAAQRIKESLARDEELLDR